ncbi:MAG TPA: N(4)-(beta-N-acetylglucosaminyl)-L-asparaginase [Clostridiales bacterium]|nr:N(4)-(beta-N-acetylglucosaminyl)-L-asparaginase [Clostridiales bacterium]
MTWSVIATWKFSLTGVAEAGKLVACGRKSLDAVEQVARYVEDDPSVDTVGYGGIPNVAGEVELDAAIMNGEDLSIGAVMGVKGYRNPISIARKVLEDTPHNILVGQGAEDFAARKGFEKTMLLSEKSIETWFKMMNELKAGNKHIEGHDTVGVVALDTFGRMASGTSTSGISMKYRGRVGDSPLVGSGFYVDDYVGGAAATGVGEDIMKGCTCFYAVELMREGCNPREAAELAVMRTHKRIFEKTGKVGNIAIVCADNKGNFGGAANHEGFEYAAASDKCLPKIYVVEPV